MAKFAELFTRILAALVAFFSVRDYGKQGQEIKQVKIDLDKVQEYEKIDAKPRTGLSAAIKRMRKASRGS